jgi:hypothetical protein
MVVTHYARAMTPTKREFHLQWTRALQLPPGLSESCMARAAQAIVKGEDTEAKKWFQQALDIHYPNSESIVKPHWAATIKTAVDASRQTRVAGRGNVAADKYTAFVEAAETVQNWTGATTDDDEYYGKCTWLMWTARSFGQYIDIHL